MSHYSASLALHPERMINLAYGGSNTMLKIRDIVSIDCLLLLPAVFCGANRADELQLL